VTIWARTIEVQDLPMKTLLAIATTLFLIITTSAMPALAKTKSNQIKIEYQLPKNPEHQEIYKLFKERNVLERLKKFLSPFRLPMPVKFVMTGCDGNASAEYGDGEIVFCYELVDELFNNRPKETTPAGIEPMDTVIGPFLDTTLHEFAHALFDMLFIPILGREEDAADQVAAYIYLQLNDGEVRRLVLGTVYNYLVIQTDTPDSTQSAKEFLEESSDTHSLPSQRAYNLLCVAYGAKPKLFSDVVSKEYLPKERAEVCKEEFEQLQQAFEDLIEPHMDLEVVDISDKPLLLPSTK
jgi:hypothetical protein